jgi:hypothetical protein
VGELQVAVAQLRAGKVFDRLRVDGAGAVRRSVIGDDDLGREAAAAEILGTVSEARR